jgi:hypothetical protein
MAYIFYVIWLVFLAMYFFQGAVTGALRKGRGRSPEAVWPIPTWSRMLCLILGVTFTTFAALVLLKNFK